MKDRNALLISALAMAIAAGTTAIPLAMPRTDFARFQMASKTAPHAPLKTAACARAITDIPAD